MANLASALKDEISRLARKEVKSQTGVTKRAATQHRRDIAELKRLVSDLSKRVAFLERQEKRRVAKPPVKTDAKNARFSAQWLKTHRNRLGFSAADYALLVGVSPQSIYNWEHGISKPRAKQVEALSAIRGLGKREAMKRLELLGG